MNHQHDDGARLAQRYSGAGRAHRVTFGPFALLVGTGVTHLLLAVATGVSFGWATPWETFSFGTAAAVGRASVWKLVRVNPEKSTTTQHLPA